MKKNLIVAAMAATAALSMSNAFAAAGTINFSGTIVNNPCQVTTTATGEPVALGTINNSEFRNAGDVSSAKEFRIVMSGCPASVTSAKVRFDGKPDSTNGDLLAIDTSASGAATNVGINLMTADKADLPLHGSNNYGYTIQPTVDNTLKFYAQYKATASNVGVGVANSVANFSVSYN